MRKPLDFIYRFLPVGQGLFATGSLRDPSHDESVFRWMHDCGTMEHSDVFGVREATRYHNNHVGKELGLLIISHFDHDHVSQLSTALAGTRIKEIVLPYFYPAMRLALAAGDAELTAEQLAFLRNPTGYFRERIAGAREARISYILPAAEGGFPPPPEQITEDSTSGDWEPGAPDAGERDIDPALVDRNVGLIRRRQPHSVADGRWEFCFYNAPSPQCTPALIASVDGALRDFDTHRNLERLKQALIPIYDREFGDSGKDRNKISLVTYTGPVAPQRSWLACPDILPTEAPGWCSRVLPRCWHPVFGAFCDATAKPSLLYTGDITMNDKRQEEVCGIFHPVRWARIGTLQVPHHGAHSSWKVKTPANWPQRWSVFSSDPSQHPYHPNAPVLKSLAGHGPLLVNGYQGVYFSGHVKYQ